MTLLVCSGPLLSAVTVVVPRLRAESARLSAWAVAQSVSRAEPASTQGRVERRGARRENGIAVYP